MEIKGRVIDELSGSAIPGATVEAWSGSVMLNRVAADNSGYFSFTVSSAPDNLLITSATTVPVKFTDYLTRAIFPTVRNVIEEGGVFIKSTIKKSSEIWWGVALLAILYLLNKKRL